MTGERGAAVPADGEPADGVAVGSEGASLWRQPPGWVFHGLLVLPALALLHSVSVPGFGFIEYLAASAVLFVAAVAWLVRSVAFLVAWRLNRSTGSPFWLLVAPIAGLVVLAAISSGLPLKARFAQSRSAFEAVVADGPALVDADWIPVDTPGRIGTYSIWAAYRVGDGVIFYERTGSLSDDAGFAYLPSGPALVRETGSFERPAFRSLGGDWYAWTASW